MFKALLIKYNRQLMLSSNNYHEEVSSKSFLTELIGNGRALYKPKDPKINPISKTLKPTDEKFDETYL